MHLLAVSDPFILRLFVCLDDSGYGRKGFLLQFLPQFFFSLRIQLDLVFVFTRRHGRLVLIAAPQDLLFLWRKRVERVAIASFLNQVLNLVLLRLR